MAHLIFWGESHGCWVDRWGVRMEFKRPMDEVMLAGIFNCKPSSLHSTLSCRAAG